MKLFALHGHLQNAKRFKGQTAALARHLKREAGIELIYLDGPAIIDNQNPDSPLRSWVKDGSVEEAKQTIAQAHEENPDVIGLFAFSMGAMLALQLAADVANDLNSPFSWIKLIVSASAPYPAGDSPLLRGFPCTSSIPVLFVTGTTDQIASQESQQLYYQYFSNKSIFTHDGGHYIPSAKNFIPQYIEFFSRVKAEIGVE